LKELVHWNARFASKNQQLSLLRLAIISSDVRIALIISKELQVQKQSNAPYAELTEKYAGCTCDRIITCFCLIWSLKDS